MPRTWGLSGAVTDIAVAPEGDVWFAVMGIQGGGGGVLHFDGQRFEEFGATDGLDHGGASSVALDREGALWVGTGYFASGVGVRRFDRDRLVTFGRDQGLGEVLGLTEDGEGRLWLQGWHTLTHFDGEFFSTVRILDESIRRDVAYLMIDARDRVWSAEAPAIGHMAHGTSLLRFDGVTVQQIDITGDTDLNELIGGDATRFWRGESIATMVREAPLDSLVYPYEKQLRHVLTDTRGTLWAGTFFAGAYGFNRGETTRLTRANGLADDHVTVLFEDADGDLWIGTGYGGVSRYNGHRVVETLTVSDGLGTNWVRDIGQTRDGHMLFATKGGGLSLYDGLVMQTIDADDGLAGNDIVRVIEDSRGDIWAGTVHGVTRYRPRPAPPLVRITRVVADRSLDQPEEMTVPSTQRVVAMHFEGRTLKAMGRGLAYVYRLRGHGNSDWRTTRDGTVVYNDLPVGDYTFEVKAVSQDLDYSEVATMGLRVAPPYGRLALQAGLALSLAGLVILGVSVARRRRERDRAREQLLHEQEEELQTARDLQMGLMPTESPRVEGLEVASRCVPATQVGGDFFQYFHRGDRLSISTADVTDHGMEAKIPVVMFDGILDSQIEIAGELEDLFYRLHDPIGAEDQAVAGMQLGLHGLIDCASPDSEWIGVHL
ncbi:MAG: hypothetical protein JRI25_16100 [Deltaproteobacteria bacterium]|nr:hypothetical protein [Deltaproteobacteria bacterium]